MRRAGSSSSYESEDRLDYYWFYYGHGAVSSDYGLRVASIVPAPHAAAVLAGCLLANTGRRRRVFDFACA